MSSSILLLHTPRDDDPYEAACRRAGYEARSEPVLRFEYVHQDALADMLERPDEYAGLVVTSPRAVEALRAHWASSSNQPTAWTGKPAFAVGPRTAGELRALGLAPQGADTGNAEALAACIERSSFEKPLLFLCGNRRRDALPDRFEKQHIDFEELCVYETYLRDKIHLPESLEWLVFFSPSGVKAMRRSDADPVSSVRRATLGPTTARALRQCGRAVHAVADRPSPAALLAAIQQAA